MNAIKGVFCSSLSCEHDYRLNEEIGIYCTRCSFVKTEIKDITLHFYMIRQQNFSSKSYHTRVRSHTSLKRRVVEARARVIFLQLVMNEFKRE
uniref:Uncharacterized protein n=1 Tax=Medicago truncatula TaxID=3880 RepID=Q1RUA2_MEDTR|nr:hypothetical protein MtrDRAFT_AC153123g32v2 [Medicago truncatula]